MMKKYVLTFLCVFLAILTVLGLGLYLLFGSRSSSENDTVHEPPPVEDNQENTDDNAGDDGNDIDADNPSDIDGDNPSDIGTDKPVDDQDQIDEDIYNNHTDIPNELTNSQVYSNGLASFTYDATKVYFTETPSDSENGYPLTTFLFNDSQDVLPRLDIVPLTVTADFSSLNNASWENLVKSLLLSYYQDTERDKAQIAFDGTVVNPPEGDSGYKAYTLFETTLDGSFTPNMSGAARMEISGSNAIITLSLNSKGNEIPKEFSDIFLNFKFVDKNLGLTK